MRLAAMMWACAHVVGADEQVSWMPGERMPFIGEAGVFEADPRRGETLDVAAFGAKPNDGIDDTAAIRSALKSIEAASIGAGQTRLRFDAGTYDFSDILFIGRSGIAVIGQGSGKTTLGRILARLLLPTSGRVFVPYLEGKRKVWAWQGGLIWIEGDHDAKPLHRRIGADVPRGSFRIPFERSSANPVLAATGSVMAMRWSGSEPLLRQLWGHEPSFASNPWIDWSMMSASRGVVLESQSQVIGVHDDAIVLRHPFPVGNVPGVTMAIESIDAFIRDVSIEGFRIEFPLHAQQPHLSERGYNAIFSRRSAGLRIHDIHIVNADNGVILERTHAASARPESQPALPCQHNRSRSLPARRIRRD